MGGFGRDKLGLIVGHHPLPPPILIKGGYDLPKIESLGGGSKFFARKGE